MRCLTTGSVIVLALALPFGCTPGSPQPGTGGAGAIATLEGRWTLCLSETTRGTGPVCGGLTAVPGQGTRPPRYYEVEHDVALDSVLGTEHGFPRFGVIAPADDGAWRLLLGVDSGVVNAYDVGVHGRLSGGADSMAGAWTRSCYAGCPERGTVVLRR